MKVNVISLTYIFQVLYVLCFTRPRYQVSVYRTIGPLVFSSVWVAEWPSFGKELLTRLTMFSLCILTFCNFSYFQKFGFEGWIWVLIASVPGICLLFTSIGNRIKTGILML